MSHRASYLAWTQKVEDLLQAVRESRGGENLSQVVRDLDGRSLPQPVANLKGLGYGGQNMKCHLCGGEMHAIVTDLPFKLGRKTIVVLRELSVLHCERCSEYMLEGQVMDRVDAWMR